MSCCSHLLTQENFHVSVFCFGVFLCVFLFRVTLNLRNHQVSLSGHKHVRHIINITSSPYGVNLFLRLQIRLDMKKCTRKGSENTKISPQQFLWRKKLTSNTCMIHFTASLLVYLSDFELLSTMTKKWRKTQGCIEYTEASEKGEHHGRESCKIVPRLRKSQDNILSQTMKGKSLCL